ncbi:MULTISPECIES: sugar ABC transporter permease [unclassified Arthrobacter]|jgi:multiple sugar transport system permease protein|uniref:carbohydrate ABC transporter permease n=1 Tax=Micrococcaceae TaxID=1268 RepID=UPI00037CAC36|nr:MULTISPECIES: sugar ABC transporter permease [unclassified Arthrobacter]BCW56240.1 sugar ABC transporter permease [Arthrobacter sp. StoSoilB19]BCW77336.1 sugar ABC transporter permease [Arthrobacter sp. NicSoilB11]
MAAPDAPAAARPHVPPAGPKVRAPRRRGSSAALLLIAPSIVFMTLLFGWPMVSGVLQAFGGPEGLTTANFTRMSQDPYFWSSVGNTLLLIVVMIPIQFVLALAMALLIRAKPRGASAYFYIWAIPLAVSDLAAGLVWLTVFTDRGYLNSLLASMGQQPVSWLAYDNYPSMFAAVLIAEVWRATSLVFVIVVAGLQSIPKDYEEAAGVFGASFWNRLWHVTLPLLRPSLQTALILRTILAFQTFAVALALTGQNFPLVVGETYRWYTGLQDPNVASALALVVMFVSMVTAVGYLKLLRDQTEAAR